MLSKSIFIVTPSYNASGTIERTIQSIINLQDVDYLRYHIQDGVSSDGTQDIIKKIDTIIKKNPVKYGHIDFSWSSEKDNGMYDAIAKGFQKMSIPDDAFMGWINADDILFPDALKKIFEVITTLQNIQWIGGRHCIIDEDDIIITKVGSPCYASIVYEHDVVALSRTVMGLKNITEVNPLYLLAFLRSKYGFQELYREREQTIQFQLTLERVRKISIYIANPLLQDAIADIYHRYYQFLQ